MFERYTETARRALFFARYEASEFGDLQIEVDHLLLGVGRESAGVAARIFAAHRISFDDLRRDIESRRGTRDKISTSVEIPFTTETKRALQFAAEEADRLGHSYIGTEHLLLGILREEQSLAAASLMQRGLRLAEARDAVAKFVQESARASSSHRTQVSTVVHGIEQLLDRLAAIASNSQEARSTIEDIRLRVRDLERQIGP